MLKKIVIRNINSVDTCEIDFSKGNYKFGNSNILKDVVNPIAIYGHNGSGKSAVMNAVAHFIKLMSLPAEALTPFVVNNFLFTEFRLDKKNEEKVKGSIDLLFNINDIDYEYFIETSSLGYISKEFLKRNGEKYFERSKKQFEYGGENKNIETSLLVPTLRSLASSQINDATIQVVFAYLSSFTSINMPFINRGGFVTSKIFSNTNTSDLLVQKSNEVRDILKQYGNFPVYSIKKSNLLVPNGGFIPQYDLFIEDGDDNKQLPLTMISTGMLNQSTLLSLLLSLPKNAVVFIDEVDATLHPSTIKSFLDVVRKKEIQIVMTLHNTYAMQSLRPDQIYFAKWSKGFSNYYRLSKIYPNIREVNNIEKMYLSSVFDQEMK